MIPDDTIQQLIARFDDIERRLGEGGDADQIVKLSKEHAELRPVVEASRAYRDVKHEIQELSGMASDPRMDAEMVDLARLELDDLRRRMPELEHALRLLLLPKDSADEASVILEIRAGTGGDEAALFAGDLFRLYERYASACGWSVDVMDASEADLGGYKEIVANVKGDGVFARLKFESGVHRVQRVPATETQGRIHTSAATVAVLPEPEEVDVQIEEKDLRVDVFRASGPGGQSVNTTDSAVRITHLPTGIVVSQQDEKSQHKNRAKALKVLRARLFELERSKAASARADARRSMVGSGDRSERIRTYNYPQGRVTDHRINLTLYKLDQVMAGEAVDELIDALITEDQAARLSAMEADAA